MHASERSRGRGGLHPATVPRAQKVEEPAKKFDLRSALRLVAGFGEAGAASGLVLTDRDRRDLAPPHELERAARLTEAIVRSALAADAQEAAGWR